MDKTWFRFRTLLMPAVAAVVLVGAACSNDDVDPILDPTMPPSAGTQPPAEQGSPDPTDAPAARELLGTVLSVDESGVSGEITLTQVDGQTEVVVMLTGLTEGPHAHHVHVGSCADAGGIAFPLDELMADEAGNAMSTTMLDVGIQELEDGHYYTVHAEGDETIGAAVGCADFQEPLS